jgi:hypothetical protein
MLESGKSYQTVANRLSASLSSVVRWVQPYRQEGRARLKAKPCFLIRLLRLVTHKNFCGLASMPLTCRGGEMLLYPLFMRSSISTGKVEKGNRDIYVRIKSAVERRLFVTIQI